MVANSAAQAVGEVKKLMNMPEEPTPRDPYLGDEGQVPGGPLDADEEALRKNLNLPIKEEGQAEEAAQKWEPVELGGEGGQGRGVPPEEVRHFDQEVIQEKPENVEAEHDEEKLENVEAEHESFQHPPDDEAEEAAQKWEPVELGGEGGQGRGVPPEEVR